MTAYEKLYINGQWVPSTGTDTLSVTDSATEEVIATIPEGTAADFAITQFFFDVDHYVSMVDELAALGVDKPVLPGIMPISNLGQITRMAHMSGADVPLWVVDAMQKAGDDLDEAERIGVELATELCATLIEVGAPGLHFYALNRSWAACEIFRNLGLRAPL